jgi:diguanylate cyclase (GGDEF)-like protein/PAS domain S-box-containing protein
MTTRRKARRTKKAASRAGRTAVAARDEARDRLQRRLDAEAAARRRVEHDLSLAAQVISNLGEGVVILDRRRRVKSVNPAFTRITGYTARDVVGKPAPFERGREKPGAAADARAKAAIGATIWAALDRDGRWEGEYWSKTKKGDDYAERLSLSTITDDGGRILQFAAVISDVTRRKEDEERILYQANYDPLTGLPNRSLFLDRLNRALSTAARARTKVGLMFIDLDGFKLVNDTLGHDIGDLLLKETSGRLGHCVRVSDTVARLGGDEFTVLMPNLDDPSHAPVVAQRILESLSQPFHLNGHESFVSASIGITVYPEDATDATELLKNADSAMYRAKELGKGNYQFFTDELNRELTERLTIKNGLAKAIGGGELSLYYQPKLDLKSGIVTGVEALMRWNSRELGVVSPARFIPVLEESGLVVEIGAWAIDIACRQHRAWLKGGLPPIRVAVNLSTRQLREPSFAAVVERALEHSGAGPDGLEIEITENLLMSQAGNTVATLKKLHDLGVRVTLDDFGTGYSSLNHLRRYPIDTIKIDGSFVSDIATNPDDAEIIRTIINMGKTLNRTVVAEGVESAAQMSLLREYGCDEIQGYYLCKPLPAAALTEFLRERLSSPKAVSK